MGRKHYQQIMSAAEKGIHQTKLLTGILNNILLISQSIHTMC